MAAADSDGEAAAMLNRVMAGGGGFFLPMIVGVMGPEAAEGATGQPQPPDRIVLVNPLTQGMVVLQSDAAAIAEMLSQGGGDVLSSGGGPPPASKVSIEALKVVEVTGDLGEAECPVCLEGYGGEGKEAVVKEMPCGHRFHGGCLEKWLGLHGSCPVCRFRMPVEDEEGSKKSGGGDGGEDRESRSRRRIRREMWVAIAVGRREEEERGGGRGGADGGSSDVH